MMTIGDLPAYGQAHAASFINSAGVQALEYLENPVAILLIKTDPVVADSDPAKLGLAFAGAGSGA